MSYRLQGTHLFLTYPQCKLTKEDGLKAIKTKLGSTMDKYIIAHELHEDGNSHLHMYIKCTRRVNYSSPRCLDIEGYHGDYQSCRNFHAVKNYCKEEDDYITNIDTFKPISDAVRVVKAKSYDNAMEIVNNSPELARDMLKNATAYKNSIASLHPTPTIKNLRFRFMTLQELVKWKRSSHALWLHGPTGTGKTEFAKSLFENPLFVTHRDMLKELSSNHDGIIFDDMNFSDPKKWTREEQIHITDLKNDRQIDVKYSMAKIPKGTPRIFTSNKPIFSNDPAIIRRIRYISVKEDLRLMMEDPGNASDSSTNSRGPPENVLVNNINNLYI